MEIINKVAAFWKKSALKGGNEISLAVANEEMKGCFIFSHWKN